VSLYSRGSFQWPSIPRKDSRVTLRLEVQHALNLCLPVPCRRDARYSSYAALQLQTAVYSASCWQETPIERRVGSGRGASSSDGSACRFVPTFFIHIFIQSIRIPIDPIDCI